MKKKIKKNSSVHFELNKKMDMFLVHQRYDNYNTGHEGGLSLEIIKKNPYVKKLTFQGEVSEDITFTGELGKNSELIYFPDGANRFKQIVVNLYKRETNEDSIGVFDLDNYYTPEDEEEVDPPKAIFSFSISHDLFDSLEKKCLESDKNILESLSFGLGVYYDENHDPIDYEEEGTLMSGWITSYTVLIQEKI